MSQLKPILNVNSNFERGNTDGFTENLTSATAAFLDRQEDRINPKRRVFPNMVGLTEPAGSLPAYATGALLKSRSDYILNGRFSRRYSIASGGDIELIMEADPNVPVDPGMVVSVDWVYRYTGAPAVFTMEIRVSNAAAVAVGYAVLPAGAPRYVPGNEFNYVWQVAHENVNIGDTNQAPINDWQRIGFSVEIPMEAAFLTPTARLTGPASATVLDVGEFSVQALDSVVHAGG